MNIGNIEINKIVSRDQVEESMKNLIPEGALYFEGYVSSGEKNRNGYIIEVDAWFFDNNKYTKDFLKNGSVLWSHDSDKPIGRPLSFEKVSENGKDLIKATGYVFDDHHTNGAIGRGIVKGFSTGHMTHESLWRNTETGVEMSSREFGKMLWRDDEIWEEYLNGIWVWVVTKAEIVEFSFVTTPSNRDSVLNEQEIVLANEISKNLNIPLNEVETLFSKNVRMSKNEKDKNATTPATEENKTPEVEVQANEVEALQNKVETLETELVEANKIIESQKNEMAEKDSSIQKLEAQAEADEKRINELEKSAKDEVRAAANISDGENTEGGEDTPADVNSFKEKYS